MHLPVGPARRASLDRFRLRRGLGAEDLAGYAAAWLAALEAAARPFNLPAIADRSTGGRAAPGRCTPPSFHSQRRPPCPGSTYASARRTLTMSSRVLDPAHGAGR